MPLHTIMTAANTVSRASPAFSSGAATITETISATSMTVTATASTSVPNGSPVRCATTSAWWTAANTVATSAAAAAAARKPTTGANGVTARIAQAAAGNAHAHHGVRVAAMPIDPPRCRTGEASTAVAKPANGRRNEYNMNIFIDYISQWR